MERLEKLINILKLTPHRQPELVKEASHRILSRPIRTDPLADHFLKPLIEILIQYCDNDDSAQRSLFNDYLNSVLLTFQHRNYQLILQVLLDEVTNNGSVRTVTAALLRISHLIANVRPVELRCEPQRILKALIEVSRRTEDESILRALDSVLQQIMPYMDHYLRRSKEMQLLFNSLIDVLLRNLQNESSQTIRSAASSLGHICSNSDLLLQSVLTKLDDQLQNLVGDASSTNRFVGFCLCVKSIPTLAEQRHVVIVEMLMLKIKSCEDTLFLNSALETLRDLFRFQVADEILDSCTRLISEKFLYTEVDGARIIKDDVKVTLQANALSCLATIIRQKPIILDQMETIFFFKKHSDVAIRNQLINIIGTYIEASWRFPSCVDQSTNCEKIKKLWVELRLTLNDENSHPDTLKFCVIAVKACLNTLLESDHCLHIVEYSDFHSLIQLYLKSNFKPFRTEVLSLFSTLNYRTLHYLERSHWLKMNSRTASSHIESLQDQIVNKIIVGSLVNEHQKIRTAATRALITVVPNLYITNLNNDQKSTSYRSSDPIVSLAQDLASEHLVVLKHADEHINHFSSGDEPVISSEMHEKLCVKNDHKFLSSSIIQVCDNPHNEQITSQIELIKSQHRVNITINLRYIFKLLELSIENSLEKGKTAISSLVHTLYELSLAYPIHQHSSSWDCRPSEYCECFTLLNFLLTYLENLNEPDVIVEDLDAYENFLALSSQLLYALCHECVLSEYEHQKMKPFHKRQAELKDGYWSDLTLKHHCIADTLEVFFTHLTKLLWLISYIIEERSNPFIMSSKQPSAQPIKTQMPEPFVNHEVLVSNRLLFGRVHKKLESSFKSSKKNLNQRDEKFYQILETCLTSISSLLEFVGMNKTTENVKDILSYLKTVSPICSIPSLICARQLLKSLFGITILALYQVDPNDWFEEESWLTSPSNLMSESESLALQGVYHHLVDNPYKIFSRYYSNLKGIAPNSVRALALLNFESRRALKVRRRIEERVKSLFEYNPRQLITPKMRQISELLKNTITEFTPIVTDCMKHFNTRGFCQYQSETIHFMSYLILLRVNYQKLALADDLIASINELLDQCGEKVFTFRNEGIENFLRNSFTFFTLLSYERGPSKPMLQVATVIQRLDDLRAKLSMVPPSEDDTTTYIVPSLRTLVEDLFIYRTRHFQKNFDNAGLSSDTPDQNLEQGKKDMFEILEAERETVAQKLLDVIENPKVYDLLSILILESRQNSSEIKYKKLSKHLLSIIPTMLSRRNVNMLDYKSLELTRIIIENISPEVFQPVNFIFETLLGTSKPPSGNDKKSQQQSQRWMSLVLIAMHVLITQADWGVFISRLHETMSDDDLVEYLLHIAQLCIAEILIQLYSPSSNITEPSIVFSCQQLSSYILYLTRMFQADVFRQLSICASDFIRRKLRDSCDGPKTFRKLCSWARDPKNGFSLNACERMFFHIKLISPDLTIFWCNVMQILNNVDCNRDYWRNLLMYDCHHCHLSDSLNNPETPSVNSSIDEGTLEGSSIHSKDESKFKRGPHINRPSSLNLSDISFNDQLRRSFIKKIATAEVRDKALNRNIIETSGEDGQLLEREVNIGNVEQCLSPNIELSRRGALCLVLDFVAISMNDVEHITWLIIHHINDIIRWSHEAPISEFITAVHGNSASSGIFIQAINSGFNNLASISFVTRLLWTLERVHYTQYGSLVVLLVEKLLSSPQLMPYRSITKNIEEFACTTVQKLLNETNKSLITTNDEVINQLTAEDLDRIYSMLDVELYPKLSKLLLELRTSTPEQLDTPTIELVAPDNSSDANDDRDEVEVLYSKTNMVFWLSEHNFTEHVSSLMSALKTIKMCLSNPDIIERVNEDQSFVCFLISTVYSLCLNILPPPTRLLRPKLWSKQQESDEQPEAKCASPAFFGKPVISIDSKRKMAKPSSKEEPFLFKRKTDQSHEEAIEAARLACVEGLFLFENIDFLSNVTKFGYLEDLIIRLARLTSINSFVLTPPSLWRQNLWPIKLHEDDVYKTNFPMVTHDILHKDYGLLKNFCDRLLKLGWTSRRQFEEAWMTLLGVLSSSLSQPNDPKEKMSYSLHDDTTLTSCEVVSTITKLLLLTRRRIMGDPLEPDTQPNQSFEDRVIELTKSIGTNLSSLRNKTKDIFDSLDLEKKSIVNGLDAVSSSFSKLSITGENHVTGYSHFLRIPAQKLRMNAIINVEMDMQDTVVIDGEQDKKGNEVDVESCKKLLLSIYKQKLRDPNVNLVSLIPAEQPVPNKQQQTRQKSNIKDQLPPPLATIICHSIVALSDWFTDYDEFVWLFDTFVQMFRQAETNHDSVQMQYLIVGLCKSAAVCCYEIPNEITTTAMINHRDVMFEKCRQSIDKCIRSDFGPLKLDALFGLYYLLEDSVNIVASGAWELDHFKQLRTSRLNWIVKLMPVILDKENSKLLTKKPQIMKLLEILCETVTESEVKSIRA